MKGRLASRAHSFKENILGAFGHHQQQPMSPRATGKPKLHNHHHRSTGPSSSSLAAAKKTNSSDNLIEYTRPKCADALIKEVQSALRYYEVRM